MQQKAYHFNQLPLPPKITLVEAEGSAIKMNEYLVSFRRELHDFDERQGYLILGVCRPYQNPMLLS